MNLKDLDGAIEDFSKVLEIDSSNKKASKFIIKLKK